MTDLKTPQAPGAAGAPLPLVGVPYAIYREEETASLLDLARLCYARRRLIAAVIAVALAVAIAAAMLLPPVYRAETLLAPVAPDGHDGVGALIGQLGDLGALVERYVGGRRDQTAEAIATLRSRALATAFIRAHGIKPQLFPERWDARAQRWRTPEVPSDFEAYERFNRDVRQVSVDRRSGLVTLAIEWRDPRLAAAWANALVQEVNARRRAQAVEEAARSVRYLQRELERTSSVEIRRSIYQLIEAQTKAMALAHARAEFAFKVIDPAVPVERPVRPRPLLLVALGLTAGAVLSLALVLAAAALRQVRQADGPAG